MKMPGLHPRVFLFVPHWVVRIWEDTRASESTGPASPTVKGTLVRGIVWVSLLIETPIQVLDILADIQWFRTCSRMPSDSLVMVSRFFSLGVETAVLVKSLVCPSLHESTANARLKAFSAAGRIVYGRLVRQRRKVLLIPPLKHEIGRTS